MKTFRTPNLLIASISPKGHLLVNKPSVHAVLVWSFFFFNSKSHPEAWTFVCVNNPEFNDIAREVYEKKVQRETLGVDMCFMLDRCPIAIMPVSVQAWETWLSEHLVQAMVNYPEAIMLGNHLQ